MPFPPERPLLALALFPDFRLGSWLASALRALALSDPGVALGDPGLALLALSQLALGLALGTGVARRVLALVVGTGVARLVLALKVGPGAALLVWLSRPARLSQEAAVPGHLGRMAVLGLGLDRVVLWD